MRYLLNYAFEIVGENDVSITVSDDTIKSIGRIEYDQREILLDRKHRFQRGIGPEMVRLLAFALETSAARDLAVIEAMMQRRDREAGALPSPVPSASQLSQPA